MKHRTFATVAFFVIGNSLIAACGVAPPATDTPSHPSNPTSSAASKKLSVDVRIDTQGCVEDPVNVVGSGDYATLLCKADGGVTTVLLPRKEWQMMLRDGVGAVDAGPGK